MSADLHPPRQMKKFAMLQMYRYNTAQWGNLVGTFFTDCKWCLLQYLSVDSNDVLTDRFPKEYLQTSSMRGPKDGFLTEPTDEFHERDLKMGSSQNLQTSSMRGPKDRFLTEPTDEFHERTYRRVPHRTYRQVPHRTYRRVPWEDLKTGSSQNLQTSSMRGPKDGFLTEPTDEFHERT